MNTRTSKQRKIHQAGMRAVNPVGDARSTAPSDDPYDSFREAIPELYDCSTQCFMCSRIYFGQDLRRCPHCGSNSVACYTPDDFSHFGRNSTANLFDVPALQQAEIQVHRRTAE